jgi:hypothetical protein
MSDEVKKDEPPSEAQLQAAADLEAIGLIRRYPKVVEYLQRRIDQLTETARANALARGIAPDERHNRTAVLHGLQDIFGSNWLEKEDAEARSILGID